MGTLNVLVTKRRLQNRIKDHFRSNLNSNQNTAVHSHIISCPNYKEILTQNLGGEPSRKQRLCFLENHFEIMNAQLSRYTDRTSYEAILITLAQPKLNEQVKHSKVELL